MDYLHDTIIFQEEFDMTSTNDIGTCSANSTVPCRHDMSIDLNDKRQLTKFLEGN